MPAAQVATEGPCDIYDAAPEGTPCVAAHSTVRALYAKYDGPLYQVQRTPEGSVAPLLSALSPPSTSEQRHELHMANDADLALFLDDAQVRQNHTERRLNITVLAPGGVADSAPQDKFCRGQHCVIERIFDQSPRANHLDIVRPPPPFHLSWGPLAGSLGWLGTHCRCL